MKKKWICLISAVSLMMSAGTLMASSNEKTTLTSLQNEQSTYKDETQTTYSFKKLEGVMVCPVQQNTTVLSPYCEERGSYTHQGIDLKVDEGTPLFAVADGTILKAAPDSKGIDNGGGNIIIINHDDGTQSRYMHLKDYAVKTGDRVKEGQVIGFSGNTGDSSTPHLHFEYWVSGSPQNPTFIFEQNGVLNGTFNLFDENIFKEQTMIVQNFLVTQN